MSAQNPVQRFETLLSNSDFLFVVYYRGHGCPFCRAYLTALHSLESTISVAKGIAVTVTSEPEIHLAATRQSTGYGGETIVDPENVLAKHLKEKGLLDVAISEKSGYEHGMAQPAVLVMKKDGTVLEKWAIVPSEMNFGGAKDRPDLKQILDNVESKMKGGEAVHEKYSLLETLG